ncbi:MAG: hypothetical protein AAFV69_13110, partial [Pseudomonadota bacterium]
MPSKPIPAPDLAPSTLNAKYVTLAHGGGGKAMRDLIDNVFVSVFGYADAKDQEDQARLTSSALVQPGAQLAFATDSFVVDPVEFP